jgi:hypothetical protein
MAAESDITVQEVDIERLQQQLRGAGIPLEHPEGPLSYDKDKKKPTMGNAPDDVVKELFARVDKDGDGMASKAEWDAARPTWKWLFDHIDKDQNGQLTRDEYRAFQKYKEENPGWRKEWEPQQ